MSILNSIKKGVANSGSNKGKVLYLKADTKKRVRFLDDVEDGIEVTIHDSFDNGINALCLEHVGKKCPYCGDNSIRTRKSYVFNVWDQDAKEVRLFMGYANNFSPLPSLVAMFESYGTLKDRDYVINREGSQTNTKYTVVPMDKAKFKNTKAKPYPEKKVIDILAKAFPVNDDVEDDSDGEDDYSEMSAKELFNECIDRDIDAAKGKKASYYIALLEEYDDAEDEDEDDDEEDEAMDYSEMSAKELYLECVERDFKNVKKKQKPKYYITLLEADDAADEGEEDDWDEEGEDEDGDDW